MCTRARARIRTRTRTLTHIYLGGGCGGSSEAVDSVMQWSAHSVCYGGDEGREVGACARFHPAIVADLDRTCAHPLSHTSRLVPLRLEALQASQTLLAKAPSAHAAKEAMKAMVEAHDAVPVLPVVTKKGESVHGLAVQGIDSTAANLLQPLYICFAPSSAPPSCGIGSAQGTRQNPQASQPSLHAALHVTFARCLTTHISHTCASKPARILKKYSPTRITTCPGVLFGITADSLFAVSKQPRWFPPADSCVACLDCSANVRMLPCGHQAVCMSCWDASLRSEY